MRFLSLPSSFYSVVGLLASLTAVSAIVKRLLLDCDYLLPESIAHVATLVVASNGKFARVKYNHVQGLEHFLRVSSVRKRTCAVVKSVTTVHKPTQHANTGEHTRPPDLPLLLSLLSAPAETSHYLAARSTKACCPCCEKRQSLNGPRFMCHYEYPSEQIQ